MTDLNQQPFLAELMEEIDRNLPNELFGVTELAEAMNMSRSNLLRKVKKETNLSVSQLISQARLKRAMDFLKTSQFNVTEVSQQVGFNSTSYFIKCFREYYGYPPGEVNKKPDEKAGEGGIPDLDGSESGAEFEQRRAPGNTVTSGAGALSVARRRPGKVRWPWVLGGAVVIALGLAVGWYYFSRSTGLSLGWTITTKEPKSIAVLPFKNESSDSSNIYLINGLMDATLTNLQSIGNLNVVSRTTAEKYRNTTKSIPEMASELNVQYFIEGSGQKIGDHILLNIQLIDAKTDNHLWARQYRRESSDIFSLQQEIASDIAREIEVFITPEELSQLEKHPTDNLRAYEFYLKGKESFYRSGPEDLQEAVGLFKQAIDQDPKFALAYAHLVMVYYYLDVFSSAKKYTTDVDDLADKAILYDPRSSESLLAKALSFAQRHRYDLATPYLERALEYSPRSGLVLHFLTEFYSLYVPDPVKYLEYSVRKVEVDLGSDSTTRAFNYFHLSNALLRNGFFRDSEKFLKKSLALNPNGFFAKHVKAFVSTLESKDWMAARTILQDEYKKSPTRFDILESIGNMNFMLRDYAAARTCYDSALNMMHRFRMDILKPEYLRIGITYNLTGDTAKGRYYIDQFKHFVDEDQTIYKDLNLAMYKLQKGEKQQALDLITNFANTHEYFISLLLLFPTDPLADSIKDEKAFQDAMKKMTANFQRVQERLDEQWRSRFENL
ncbi:MAG TPA: helix-turn-helix domain-containing protein [Chryseolinea sp.]|nr:helix-turn-helix domain-containing protein [Chryseolinea sp.]